MTPRRAAILVALMGALAARRAPAAEPPCAPVIDAAADVRAQWPTLQAALRDALAARVDVDACAQVGITTVDGSIAVKVTLPDGRVAARLLSRSDDVLPTLEGLLLLPEAPRTAAQVDGPPPAPAAARATVQVLDGAVPVVSGRGVTAPVPAARPAAIRVELAVATGARLGGGQAGLGIGARSLVEVGAWLVGFEGRVDGYQPLATGAPTGALELSLLGGRRLRFSGTLALDVVAGVALAVQGASKSVKQVDSPEPAVTTASFRADPRLVVGVRLGFRASSRFRPFVGVDGDFGGAPSASELRSDLPPLPAWTLGLALGAAVGTN